jgi:Putative Flp pilus-assembly TadE/G-like
VVLFVAVLMGVGAVVLDVGAWYRADRKLQATADAAALAGAHALPDSPGEASALALQYADKNDGGVSGSGLTFLQTASPSDTLRVRAQKPMPGFFSKVFGLDSVDVGATATARAGVPVAAKWAAPIGVDEKHPLLQCQPLPCFNQQTTLDLDKVGPGAFRLLNIDDSHGGTGPSTLADWIMRGYEGWMPLNWYFSDAGAKFNSSQVKNALDARIGQEMLFPVYRGTRSNGANFEYEVVGWVGFHLTGFDIKGSKNNKLHGWFTRIIWEGLLGERATDDDFGVRAVSLIE